MLNRLPIAAVLMMSLCTTFAHAEEPTTRPASQTIRAFHVGNSLTDAMKYDAIVKLAAARGNHYILGRHTIPGGLLTATLDDTKNGAWTKSYGQSPQALANFEWDVVTLQPFDRQLDSHKTPEAEHESDLPTAIRFVDLIIQKSPHAQIYIYAHTPRRDTIDGKWQTMAWKPMDYSAKWLRPYTAQWDGSYETRDYFTQLVSKLNEHFSDKIKPVKIIPVGDVMLEVDTRIKAGQIPGVTKVDEMYKDSVHLNDMGCYVIGLTFYSTIFHDDPRGLPSADYGDFDPKTVAALQDAVWSVVSSQRQ